MLTHCQENTGFTAEECALLRTAIEPLGALQLD